MIRGLTFQNERFEDLFIEDENLLNHAFQLLPDTNSFITKQTLS